MNTKSETSHLLTLSSSPPSSSTSEDTIQNKRITTIITNRTILQTVALVTSCLALILVLSSVATKKVTPDNVDSLRSSKRELSFFNPWYKNHHFQLPTSSESDNDDDMNECVRMCTGVIDSTCMVVGNEFPFPNGILGGLVLSIPSQNITMEEDGIDYYLLSVNNPYLGPLYLEYGHYTLTKTSAPNATNNCAGGNDLQYRFGSTTTDGTDGSNDDVWSNLHLDMEWNTANDGKTFYLGTDNGFGCQYRKLYGWECRKAYFDIIEEFAIVGNMNLNDMNVPDIHELCG